MLGVNVRAVFSDFGFPTVFRNRPQQLLAIVVAVLVDVVVLVGLK